MILETGRLVMRSWREEDLEPFAALNADPEVMEFFRAPLSREESDAFAGRIMARMDELGYGLWALEVRETGEFIGFTGLALQTFEAHFTPAVEVGWRLARSAWGHGYASEAARRALDYGFAQAGLAEIVSMTAAINVRSRAVMERIGMTRDPDDDFGHPAVEPGHPLHPHVLYRVVR
ncbi:GNAT family N-acetyltransferase [Nonomuraea sp. NPDC050556]|uniref:GNAT family N-acetyltransferase n=1 Tax=Nonomuraea sp. NPDC050556 TaxID=3364369 RepID=UPI0037B6B4D6